MVPSVLADANGQLLAMLGIKGMPARGSGAGHGDAPHAGRMPAACVAPAPPSEKGTQGKMPQEKAGRKRERARSAHESEA